ncbi:GntR family transcriptional regulator [Salisediminibacterium halotolerans]|uniref:DNA-binding transcriptional regulator YhcF, GntR family n=1 Tax=Salisediminibacterium halotolerans TaxID=517425 RepID=A0A1H9SWB0_9BACI|nr:GntR family transcriptional regulator [Salisediminibacterium haloalkalitolerans]SER89195.1 DNA-binding transcriptional regulator YhcF, GntR family [Salisediminibacterium haloalkalitolerans]
MKPAFDDRRPIFLQIKEQLEDQIVNGQLQEHEQIPSTTKMVQFYEVNHLTIAKGMNQLVDEGIIYKKRGVGMFVNEGAREKLRQKRKEAFADTYVRPMLQEAKKLGLSEQEVKHIIKTIEEGGET